MRTYRLPFVLILALFLIGATGFTCLPAVSQPETPQSAPALTIAIQPLGKISASRLENVRKAIVTHFLTKVTLLPMRPLPEEAYYEPRKRYRAEKLLTFLIQTTPQKYTKVIGITDVDISTTKDKYADWGVFGLGSIAGRSCVVSSYRLGGDGNSSRFRQRLSNIVVHELGHTLGVNHCPTRGCVMQDAQGTIQTVDGETGNFCRTCREQVKVYLR